MADDARKKYKKLLANITELGRVCVNYSEGPASALLLAAATEALGRQASAATALPFHFPASCRDKLAVQMHELAVEHKFLSYEDKIEAAYGPGSAYRRAGAKISAILTFIGKANKGQSAYKAILIDPAGIGDRAADAEVLKAANDFSVPTPLKDAGFSMEEIKSLVIAMNIPIWRGNEQIPEKIYTPPSKATDPKMKPVPEPIQEDEPKPPASRETEARRRNTREIIYYAQEVASPEAVEEFLTGLAFDAPKAKVHGELLRLIVAEDDIPRFEDLGIRKRIVSRLREMGFAYVTLDLNSPQEE